MKMDKKVKKIKAGKMRRIYMTAVVALAMSAGTLASSYSVAMTAYAADNKAASMKMAKAEGTVSISGSSGKSITLIDNMKLYNGYQVDTTEESYAWIELDGTKFAKLDAVSKAEIRKSGKKLEILVESGNIFFNITEPLKDDETMNIRTATMVAGIRGTSGWLEVTDEKQVRLSVLEGNVEMSVTNPLTGEVKSDSVASGESAVCAVTYDPQNAGGDAVEIARTSFAKEDIGGFVLQEVFADTSLAEKIVEKGGLDLRDLTQEEVDTRLMEDKAEVHEKMVVVETAAKVQEEAEVSVVEQLWTPDGIAPDDNGPDDNAPAAAPVQVAQLPVNPAPNPAAQPATPAVPQTTPQTPTMPQTQTAPQASTAPETQTTPQTQATPETPTVPQTQATPEVPAKPEKPAQPDAAPTQDSAPQTNPGNNNSGNSNPGDSNPGNANPGNNNPGNTNPGNNDSGNNNSGGGSGNQESTTDSNPAQTQSLAPTTHTVRFESGGGSNIPSQTVAGDGAATEPSPAPVRDAHTFGGWFTDSACTQQYSFGTAVRSDITLYAKWIEKTYTVKFWNGFGDELIAQETVKIGDRVKAPVTGSLNFRIDDSSSFTFSNWYSDARCTTLYNFEAPVNKNITLYAGGSDVGWTGDAKWFYNQTTNRLKIFGSGAMGDYETYSMPWSGFVPYITGVDIGTGITSIGNHAFFLMQGVTSVTIPNSVRRIGEYAFAGTFLSSVTIHNNVNYVGLSAFASCEFAAIGSGGSVTDKGVFRFEGSKAQWNAATDGHNPFYGSNPSPTKVVCSDGEILLDRYGTVRQP